jgi:hypothetical protein
VPGAGRYPLSAPAYESTLDESHVGILGEGIPKEEIMEDTIASDKIQIERKLFFFDLKENRRGILLRITEDVRGHRDTIIVPATGLKDFSKIIQRMIEVIDNEGLDPTDPLAFEEEEGEFGDEDEILEDDELDEGEEDDDDAY